MAVGTEAEIERLLTEYCYAVDRGDYATVRTLYHPDAIEDHGDYVGDIEGFIAWARKTQEHFLSSAHLVSNVRIAIEGDRAESEARGTTYIRLNGDRPSNMIVIGRHFDSYERRDGSWRFIHRALCVDWTHVFPPESAEVAVVSAVEPGRLGPDDPSYRRLKLLHGRGSAANSNIGRGEGK